MKQPESWSEADLLELITNKAEESISLEFKRADALGDGKNFEVGKDVSAFANSAGGTLVYGVEESPDEPHYAIGLSPVAPRVVSKEWIEQVINSRIQPRISGIVINPVELKTTHPGKFAYLVVVPEGSTAHQASDKKYYKRFNFQSVAMEDYEVRQVMERTAKPAYEFELAAGSIMAQSNSTDFRFRGILQNVSEIVGHEVSVVLFAPRGLVNQPDDYQASFEGIPYTRIPSTHVVDSRNQRSAVESAHPLTPYALEFPKSISFQTIPNPPAPRFTAIVKVYDSFGLALSVFFHVHMPSCQVSRFAEEQARKRARKQVLEFSCPRTNL